MKFLVIIQARCGSSRLPSKVLKDLCGKTVLEHVIERVQRSAYIDEVMVATTINQEDIPIVRLVSGICMRIFAGSSLDVLDRYYQAAKLIQPEYIIRITADCPVFDAEILDDAIQKLKPETDYMAALSETLPDGLDLEIIKFTALEKAWREANHSYEREHVTQYIIRHPELFKQQDFVSPVGDFGNYRWTVDEPEDFQVVTKIYHHFLTEESKEDFHYQDILKYLKENPQIVQINRKYKRNEGLEKSIREDRMIRNGLQEMIQKSE